MATMPSTALAWLRSLCWSEPPETQAMPRPGICSCHSKAIDTSASRAWLAAPQETCPGPSAHFLSFPSLLPPFLLPLCCKSHPCQRTALPKLWQCRDNSTEQLSRIPGSWGTATGIIPQPWEASGSSPVLWHFSYYYQGEVLALQWGQLMYFNLHLHYSLFTFPAYTTQSGQLLSQHYAKVYRALIGFV